MKSLMVKSLLGIMVAILSGTAVWATAVPEEQGGSLLLMLFIGFFALIVVFQLVPACLLFIGMVRGLLMKDKGCIEKSSKV